jgi:flagellar motor switch protein FliG
MDETGLENAAILLMSLGEEDAAEVLKHLTPREVQGVGETISRLKSIPRERVENVLEMFSDVAGDNVTPVGNTDEYVRTVLRRALGDDKANILLDRILQPTDVEGIDNLKWMDTGAVAELMRDESPQIVAAILVHLESAQASAVLRLLPERHRNEVMVRIATLDGIQPAGLKDLNEVMSSLLTGNDRMRTSLLGGAKSAAEMLNSMGSSVETSALDFIRDADAELAQQIMDNMFSFEDLVKVDDKGMQALLKEVQTESLVIALKAAPAELKEKIFKNMSTRAGETLKEELETRGPVRVVEVESEQKEMLKIVRRLIDEGVIVLGGANDDEFI